jgi:hypothetical protein
MANGALPCPGLEDRRDEDLSCPSCSGKLRLDYQGPQERDKVAVCPYCRRVVDVPEARSFARERITEKPGSRVEERVMTWEGEIGPEGIPPWVLNGLREAVGDDEKVLHLAGDVQRVVEVTSDTGGRTHYSKTTTYGGDSADVLRLLQDETDGSSSSGSSSFWTGVKKLFGGK